MRQLCSMALGAVLACLAGSAAAETFTVNSPLDAGDHAVDDGRCSVQPAGSPQVCTLRAAIQQANALEGSQVIQLLAGEPIRIKAPLPYIRRPTTLRSGDTTYAIIQWTGTGPTGDALVFEGGGSVAQRLAILGFKDGAAIRLLGKGGNQVISNLIGLDNADAAQPNGIGVFIDGVGDNQVGGITATARNVISGNASHGVLVRGAEARGNRILGNHIGTDAAGAAARGNGGVGVWIDKAPDNRIGGETLAAMNVISGNEGGGVVIQSTTETRVLGNRIGTSGSGDGPAPNRGVGVLIENGWGNFIGGPAPVSPTGTTIGGSPHAGLYVTPRPGTAEAMGDAHWPTRGEPPGNLISGNGGSGILIRGAGAGQNQVEGNFIGANRLGSSEMSNGGMGVSIQGGAGNKVGTPRAGAGNLISGNLWAGVKIEGADARANSVQGNWIGLDITGQRPIANFQGGVHVEGAPETVIGGDTALARNVVSGNGLPSLTFHGVYIRGAGAAGSRVQGNIIGLTRDGEAPAPNVLSGLVVTGVRDVLIGGLNGPAAGSHPRNLISGNGGQGIAVLNGSEDVRIQGNIIGPDRAGAKSLRGAHPQHRQQIGVWVAASRRVTVGDVRPEGRNLISGNDNSGVLISAGRENTVLGNYVGVDAGGTQPLGNRLAGVAIFSSDDNTVGAMTAIPGTEGGNLISGNWGETLVGAVHVQGPNARGNRIIGNLVGTTADGAKPVPNLQDGVNIRGQALDTRVGDRDPRGRNVIAFNGRSGVVVADGRGHAILSNSLHDNTALGIDLGADGIDPKPERRAAGPVVPPTPGPNDRRFSPTLHLLPGKAWATLEGPPEAELTVQFFANPRGHVWGYGEGHRLLETVTVKTNANGFASFPAPVPGGGDVLSATATDAAGNTSEFSKLACPYRPLDVDEVDALLANPKLKITAAWVEPTTRQAKSSLFQRPIVPIRLTDSHDTMELKVEVQHTDPGGEDDLTHAYVVVTVRNLGALAPVPETRVFAERRALDAGGRATLRLHLRDMLTTLAAGENRNFLEAEVAVCYRGRLQTATTDKLLHLMREKLIVFVPGIFGSTITVRKPIGESFAFPNLSGPSRDLMMKEDGSPTYEASRLNLLAVPGTYRLQEALRKGLDGNALPDLTVDGHRIRYFYAVPWPYDWRLDLGTHVTALVTGNGGQVLPPWPRPPSVADLLKAWKTEHGATADFLDDKVALVGHSMGGLIVRAGMTLPSAAALDQSVDRAFFINVPFLGAPKVYYAYLKGDMGVSPFISHDVLKDLAQNMPSIYHLGPADHYRDTPSDDVVAIHPGALEPHRERREPPKPAEAYMVGIAQLVGAHPWNVTLSRQADLFHGALYGKRPRIGWANTVVYWSESQTPDTYGPIHVRSPLLDQVTPIWTFGDETVPTDSQVGGVPEYVTQQHPDTNAPGHVAAANDGVIWDDIVDTLGAPKRASFLGAAPLDELASGASPNSCSGVDRAAAIRAAEAFGEAEMSRRAAALNYQVLLAPVASRTFRQGFDGVYCDGELVPELRAVGRACEGGFVIGEAKGGYVRSSLEDILGSGYGYRQGTLEWAGYAADAMRQKAGDPAQVGAAEDYVAAIGAGRPVRVEVFHSECVSAYPGKKPGPAPPALLYKRYRASGFN